MMKSYTDLEQSKKLEEFLPIESADMHYSTWTILDGEFIVSPNQGDTIEDLREDYGSQIIPCWSLAALLDFLSANFYVGIKHLDTQWELDCRTQVTYAIELVDACVEMICQLKERNLL